MAKIEDLRPIEKQRVVDITQKVGVTMSTHYDWSFEKKGGPYLIFEWIDRLEIDPITNGISCWRSQLTLMHLQN